MAMPGDLLSRPLIEIAADLRTKRGSCRGSTGTASIFRAGRRSEPDIVLDESEVNGAVPPELAALRVEPPAVLDRVAVANAALAALSEAEFRDVVRQACVARNSPVAATDAEQDGQSSPASTVAKR
jgi:hypothetical protein